MTMSRLVACALIASLVGPGPVLAQAPPEGAEKPEPVAFDASKLGVSLDRIKRELSQPADAQSSDSPLKLSFTVQVVGTAPKINLLEGFAFSGPLPYGSPTHQEVLDVLTPQAYKSPMIPFSALGVWAAKKMWERSKKQQCEDEIADYKRLVMAGVSVAAPRCTQ